MLKALVIVLLSLMCNAAESQISDSFYYNILSESFLKTALAKEDHEAYRKELDEVSYDTLAVHLDTDSKRLAFWINIYNAYVQYFLQTDPSSYRKKQKFFAKKQIPIFGKLISFDKIEHGIIRSSQWKYGLGNFRNLLRPEFERLLRVENRDFRVHFVLNCGAKSCPPVVILKPHSLNDKLDQQTTSYLTKTTRYDSAKNEVHITKLFSWFRGDFGNRKGILKLLVKEGLIPLGAKPKFKILDYDWTIDLDNWIIETAE